MCSLSVAVNGRERDRQSGGGGYPPEDTRSATLVPPLGADDDTPF